MLDFPPSVSAADWIAVLDAVLAISSTAKCDPAAAAEVLLAFTKSVNVEVLFCGYFVEDRTGDGDERLPNLWSTIAAEDWQAFFLARNAECLLDWNQSNFVFSSYSGGEHNKSDPERVTTYTNVHFRRSNLKYFLDKERQRSGAKFGSFWPKLAEATAFYFVTKGLPGSEFGSQAKAVKAILDELALIGEYNGEAAAKNLVRDLNARLLAFGGCD